MKRDVAVIPFDGTTELVIASDNSGAIGMKPMDDVSVPYETVSHFSFRVAYMECVSAGALPFSVVLYNFCGDPAWSSLVKGIKKAILELGLECLPITGSTETNFALKQSAVGLAVLGKREKREENPLRATEKTKAAVIGKPLVGNEVAEEEGNVAPLLLFQSFAEDEKVLAVVPVGSKGIRYELEQLFWQNSFQFDSELDLEKSSGPSTCFVIAFEQAHEKEMRQRAGHLFYPIQLIKQKES